MKTKKVISDEALGVEEKMCEVYRRTVSFDLTGMEPYLRGQHLEVTLDVQQFHGKIFSPEFILYMNEVVGIDMLDEWAVKIMDEVRRRQWVELLTDCLRTQE